VFKNRIIPVFDSKKENHLGLTEVLLVRLLALKSNISFYVWSIGWLTSLGYCCLAVRMPVLEFSEFSATFLGEGKKLKRIPYLFA